MIFKKLTRSLWLFAIVTGFLVNSSWSQEQSTDYVPKEAFAALIIDLEQLKKAPGSEFIPFEIIEAFGKRDYGFDPTEVESAKLIFALDEERPEMGPSVGAIIELKKSLKLAERLKDQGPSTVVDGTEIYFDNNLDMHMVQADPKTVLFASSEPFAVLMAASKKVKNPFTKLLASTKTSTTLKAIASVEKIKPFIMGMVEEFPAPPPFGAANKLPQQIKSIDIASNVAAGIDMTINFVGYSDGDAKKIDKTIKQLLTMAKAAALTAMAAQVDSEDVVQQAQYDYVARIADKIEKELTPTRKGDTVTIKFKNDIATVGVLTGLLLPAVQAAREAARRTQAANDIKQINLSFHNYHDVNKRFPAQAIMDKKGNKLLSWRVEVLPYIGEQELYDQFKKDEPWDSDHNIKLLDRMPMIYRNPSSAEETATNFLAVTGEGTAFDGKFGKKYSDFRDGTSNSLLFVEADKFVPWTKPEDFEVDWDNPTRGLGRIRPGIFQAGFADGSVQPISNNVDMETLKNMFKISDGKVINR